MRLQDRVTLITGGASGLGRAIALAYAREGARVAIIDANGAGGAAVAAEIEALGGRALALQADVARVSEVRAAVDRVCDAFGRIDALVNCAGISTNAPFLDATEESFDRVLAVDLKGTFFVAQIVAHRMVEQGGGVIINVASQAGAAYVRGLSVEYHAAKAAVIQLTRVMAVELGGHGVRVNAIAPALILTPLTQHRWDTTPAMREYHLAKLPLKRVGQPADIVGPAVFLASDESAYLTGHTLFVDGGYLAD